MIVFFGVVLLGLFSYGVLNVVTPRTTARWQRARTDPNDGGISGAVGRTVQRGIGVDVNGEPTSTGLRRIRIFGVVEIVVSVAIAAALLAAR